MQRLKTNTKLLSLTLCSIFLLSCNEEEIATPEKITSVTIKNLSDLLVEYTFKRPANVISINDSIISTQLNAPVKTIRARVGDTVKKGAALIELDCSDERNRLQQAAAQVASSEASAQLSQSNYESGQKLRKQDAISEQEMNRLESEYARSNANQLNAKAAYTLSKNNVNKCTIRAPFNAIVMERNATVGQLAAPGTPMVRLIDSDNLEVSGYLASNEANIIAQSTAIYFQQGDKKFPLRIRALTPAVDSIRRTQEVRLTFKDEKPIAGSSGELIWQHPLPALPTEYLSQRNNRLGVLFADNIANNKAKVAFTAIEDAREGQPAIIKLGSTLNSQTPILIDGRFGVTIEQDVQIVQPTNN